MRSGGVEGHLKGLVHFIILHCPSMTILKPVLLREGSDPSFVYPEDLPESVFPFEPYRYRITSSINLAEIFSLMPFRRKSVSFFTLISEVEALDYSFSYCSVSFYASQRYGIS